MGDLHHNLKHELTLARHKKFKLDFQIISFSNSNLKNLFAIFYNNKELELLNNKKLYNNRINWTKEEKNKKKIFFENTLGHN